MNKIFKVIWNHTTQTWIAVSELGKSKTKSKSKTDKRVAVGLVALGAIGLSGNVFAAQVDGQTVRQEVAGTTAASDNNLIIIGDNNTYATTIGGESRNSGTTFNIKNTVIGIDAKVGFPKVWQDGAGTSIKNADGYGRTVVIGNNAAGNGPKTVTIGADADSGYSIGSVVIGFNATGDTRVNGSLGYNGAGHVKYHNPYNNMSSTGPHATAVTIDNARQVSSPIAIGHESESFGGGIALGDRARAYIKDTKGGLNTILPGRGLGIAIGGMALSHAGGVSIGAATEATGINSMAFGRQAVAKGDASVAVGSVSAAVGNNAISMGQSATSLGIRSIAIGGSTSPERYDAYNRTLSEANTSIAFGAGTIIRGTDAVNSTAIGTDAFVTKAASAIAAGHTAYIDGESNASVAIGKGSVIHAGAGSVGLGENTHVGSSSNASAIGNSAKAFSNGTIAFGHNAFAGGLATTQADQDLTALETAYNNAKAAYDRANPKTAALQYARDFAKKALDEAKKANEILKKERDAIAAAEATEEAENSIAIGTNTKAIATNAIAMGKGSVVSGISSIAVGTENIVKGNYSGAFGDPSIVEGTASYTFGNDNVVGSSTTGAFVLGNRNRMGAKPVYTAEDDTARVNKAEALKGIAALGDTTEALRDVSGSVVIGNDNTVTSKNTFILGNSVNTIGHVLTGGGTVENSVYLGSNSTAVAGAPDAPATLFNIKDDGTEGDSTTGGDKGIVNDATVAGIDYQGFQGNKADGVVTVGSADHERRIQNVAAGEISATSTDAINGSQLYLITKAIGDVSDNNPFSYSVKEGDKNVPVTQVDGKFYKDEDLAGLKYDPSTQKFYDATTGQVAPDPKEVPADTVNISSAVDGETDSPSTVNNVKGNLPATYNDGDLKQDDDTTKLTNERAPEVTKSQTLPTDFNLTAKYNNAATVGDVLNAGWNLQGNGIAKDFVKPYDTVNFADGTGTTVEVETSADGKLSTIKVNTATQYTDSNGTPVTVIDGKGYAAGAIKGPDGKVYPKGTTFDENNMPKDDKGAPVTALTPLTNNPQISLVNGDKTSTTPTVLGNVAQGANTITNLKDANNKPLVKVGDKYYKAEELENGAPKADAVGLTLTKAEDGKYYTPDQFGTDGNLKPDAKETALTPVSTKPAEEAKVGLADLDNSNPNNALTVADAKNLGWVVSSNKKTGDLGKEYADDVRNANEVRFVGTGLATVSGETKDDVRIITVDVNAQTVAETAQLPVVYTDKDGNKLIKGDDGKFYPADSVKIDGKYYPADSVKASDGKIYPKDKVNQDGSLITNNGAAPTALEALEPTKNGDVIASMNNGNNESKDAPMNLANLKGNLPQTVNVGDKEELKDGSKKLGDTAATAATPRQEAPDNIGDIYNNAATVGDVLNAGWNLGVNGDQKDFVKPYDTVNFVNGVGTLASVETRDGGKVSDVTFNIDKGKVTSKPDGALQGTSPEEIKKLEEDIAKAEEAINPAKEAVKEKEKALETAKAALEAAAEDAKDAEKAKVAEAEKALKDAQDELAKKESLKTKLENNLAAVPNKVATVENVVRAVNNSGFNIYQDDTTEDNHKALVNPGDKVVYKAAGEARVNVSKEVDGTTNITYSVDVPVIYTDKAGNKLVKGEDGKFYTPDALANLDYIVTKNPDGTKTGKYYPKDSVVAGDKVYPAGSVVVGDKVYPEGTIVVDGKAYPKDSVLAENGKVYPKGTKLDDLTGLPTDKNVAPATEATALTDANVAQAGDQPAPVTDVIASMNSLKDGKAKEPMVLSNVAQGTNTIGDKEKDGTPLVKVGDAYYKATDLENGVPKQNPDKTFAQPVTDGTDVTDPVKKAQGGLADLTNSNPNNAITVADAKNFGWVVSTPNNQYAQAVKNANTVNFIGEGGVGVSGENNATTGMYDVKIKLSEAGTLEVKKLTDAAGKDVPNTNSGKVKVGTNPGGFVSSNSVANAINNSGFWIKASAADGGSLDPEGSATKTPTSSEKGELINPGDEVEMLAGKNMRVRHDAEGRITYSTKDDVNFNSVGLNQTDEAGKPVADQPVVNLKNEEGILADNTADGEYLENPTALNISSKTGTGPDAKTQNTQLTGVGSVLSTRPADESDNAVGAAKDKKLVDLGTEDEPLEDKVLDSAATVRDLANMGWVVSTSEDGKETYSDVVKNANKVDFKGKDGISVTGETNADGVREITIALKKGEVISSNAENPKTKDNNTPLTKVGDQYFKTTDVEGGVVKVGDSYYKAGDFETKDGVTKLKDNVTALTPIASDNVTSGDAGAGFVTGNQVGDAIQASGWTVGKATKEELAAVNDKFSAEAGPDKVEKVNPDDNLRFADGKGIKVSLGTVKAVDNDGVIKTTTTVKVDVESAELENNTDGSVKDIADPTKLKALRDAEKKVADAKQAVKDAEKAKEDAKQAVKDAQKAQADATQAVKDAEKALADNQDPTKKDELQKALDAAKEKAKDPALAEAVKVAKDKAADPALDKAIETAEKEAAKPELAKAVTDAKAELAKDPAANKVATAQNVADAINKSGFTLKTSAADGGEKVSGENELINPGKTVEMVAGKNMTVKQDKDGKITYATKDDVNFNSVQFGDKGPKIQRDGDNIKVSNSTGGPTKITNVAPGEADTDAVNVKQLKEAVSNINNGVGDIHNRVNKLDHSLRAGIAGANAAAGLPQVYIPGKSMVAASVGTYKGQSAVAVGYSRASDNGKVILKLQGNANTRGDFGGSVGIGYQW